MTRVVYADHKTGEPHATFSLTPAEYEDWVSRRWTPAARRKYAKNRKPYRSKREMLCVMGLGIGGEAGEVQELLKKHIRDDKNLGENLLLELGDVLHYTVRIGQVFGFTLQDIIDGNVDKLTARDAGKEKG